jgi:hypothetical protein
MDVHGAKLVRTLFTIATGVKSVPPNKSLNRSGKSASRIKLDPAKLTQLAPPG